MLEQRKLELRQLFTGPGADRDDGGKFAPGSQLLQERQQRLLVADAVHFVDSDDDRAGQIPQLLQHPVVILLPVRALDHQHHHVHIAQTVACRPIEITVHGTWLPGVQTGGVDEDDLIVPGRLDAEDTVPRGLRASRGNTYFLPDQPVQQAGFAHIGPAYQRHQTALKLISRHPAAPAYCRRPTVLPCAGCHRCRRSRYSVHRCGTPQGTADGALYR